VRLLLPEPRPLTADDLLDLYDPGDAPSLRAGFVVTTDGGIAHEGTSRTLQTPADEAVFHALRGVADAVVVGAGTARAEDYGPVRPRAAAQAWRQRRGLPDTPPLVLVSRSLDLDPGARCFAGPSVVVTCAAAPGADRFPDVIVAGDHEVDLAEAVRQLGERGLTRLLCEGGPHLLTALLAARLVDELCLTHTPRLLGPAPGLLTQEQDPPVDLQLQTLVDGGDGVLLARYRVGQLRPRRTSSRRAAPGSA
jgi:riboflavin biosynthesis pyrimidine reductase